MSKANTLNIYHNLAEADNITSVPYKPGQFIICDDGTIFYDKATKTSKTDGRTKLNSNKVHTLTTLNSNIESIKNQLINDPKANDLCIVTISNNNINTNQLWYYEKTYNNNYSNIQGEWKLIVDSSSTIDDIYITKNLKTTFDIGDGDLNKGLKILNSQAMSLTEFLESILIKEKDPIITYPEISNLKIEYIQDESIVDSINLDKNFKLHITGTIIPPTYKYEPNQIDYNIDNYSTELIITCESTQIAKIINTNNINKEYDCNINNLSSNSDITITFTYKLIDDLKSNIGNTVNLQTSNSITIFNTKPFYKEIAQYITLTDTNNSYTHNDAINSHIGDLTKPLEINVTSGTAKIIITSKYYKLSKVINESCGTNMIDCFKQELNLGSYYVWSYTPANKYSNNTKLYVYMEERT